MRIERVTGPAHAMLEAGLPDPFMAAVARVMDLERTTLILGSRQGTDVIDTAAVQRAGIDVAQRRSGGGAVLLVPGRCLCIDVLLPPSDPRWVDDVGRSFHWLGDLWVAALADLGVAATSHRGALEKTPWGSLVCFGAIGPGEVVLGARKIVGMSQRRSRAGARFQCLVHESWQPSALLALLSLTPTERANATSDLRHRAAGPGVPLAELERAVLARLAAGP